MTLYAAVHLWFCTALLAGTMRGSLGSNVGARFKSFSNQKKESVETGDVKELFGTRSALECSESPCENGGEYLATEDRCKCVESYAGLTCQRIMRDFNQNWQAYKEGFGTHYNNFWIGNNHLHQITKQGIYELEVGVQRYNDRFKYVYYEHISVGSEGERYALHLGSYRSGTLGGDSLTPINDPQRNINGKPFSTFDNDVSNNCSATMQAGWWFAELCTAANLNGPFVLSGFPRISWLYPFGNDSVANVYMQIRKKSYYKEMS
ncbi:fibrinogen-like protein A [Liolophura sinensis]|uniref:fibrinogen-like protein A n=1 Tax=Liolophura sinensis TaxID=3198878 RepID=UPI003158591E